jgi:hypothetical protein
MSSAFKTLTTSDFSVVPYKAKKSLEYPSCSAYDEGFRVYKASNTPFNISGSTTQDALHYSSVKNLYYSYYLSASLQTGSAFYNYNQSTAVSGSYQSDIRNFPTASNVNIKVLSVPQNVYGEAISPKTFKIIGDTAGYYIVDDGNGNLIDLVNCIDDIYGSYFPTVAEFEAYYPDTAIYDSDLLYDCISAGKHVGNIIYPHGILVITNPDYYCLFDAGPTVSDVYEVFFTTDNPKIIYPLTTATTDCSPVDNGSLELVPISGQNFPSNITTGGTIVLNEADPLTNTEGTYYTDYIVKSQVCSPSNTSTITVHVIDCTITGGVVYVQPTPTPTQTPTITPTQTNTPTPTPTITPTITVSPAITPSVTPTNTVTPTVTPTNTITPTRTPTSTVTPTVTPTITPSTTPQNYTKFTICAYASFSQLYWNVYTLGDTISGAAPTTDVTFTFDALVSTATGNQYLPSLTATVSAGTWSSATSTIPITGLTSVLNVFSTNVTPSSNGTQIYLVDGTCLNTPGCSC